MPEFNQYQKADQAPLIIYADLECIIKEIDGCKSNPENLSTKKLNEYIPSGFSMSTISPLKSIAWFMMHIISMMYTEVKIAWKGFVNS